MAKKNEKPPAEAARFTKRQLAESAALRDKRDLVNALLDENKTYTMEEAKRLLHSFLERKVK